MRALAVALALGSAAPAIGGCALLSDFHTTGYSRVDSGACTGTSDCDAGQVCCVAPQFAARVCGAPPCAVATPLTVPIQLCHGDGDCADAGCIAQTCTYASNSLGVSACGAISSCVPAPPDAASD